MHEKKKVSIRVSGEWIAKKVKLGKNFAWYFYTLWMTPIQIFKWYAWNGWWHYWFQFELKKRFWLCFYGIFLLNVQIGLIEFYLSNFIYQILCIDINPNFFLNQNRMNISKCFIGFQWKYAQIWWNPCKIQK